MPDYPTDIDLNEEKDIHLDGANDLALTSGIEQLQQSVAIDVSDVLQEFVGGRISGRNLGLLEERVRRSLERDEQLSTVQGVNVSEYNRESQTVTVGVRVADEEDFEIELI